MTLSHSATDVSPRPLTDAAAAREAAARERDEAEQRLAATSDRADQGRSGLAEVTAAAAALERRVSEAEAERRRAEGAAAAAEARAEELQRQLRVGPRRGAGAAGASALAGPVAVVTCRGV